MPIVLKLFFYNQPQLYQRALEFFRSKKSYWYDHTYNSGSFEFELSEKKEKCTVSFYPDGHSVCDRNYSRKKWEDFAPLILKCIPLWPGDRDEDDKVYCLLVWIYTSYMQNSIFLFDKREAVEGFPRVEDDFSNLESVRGALGTLFVPASIAYYSSAMRLIEEFFDKDTAKIIQDYFNDMLYTIPSLKWLHQDALALRQRYGGDK